MQAFGGQLSDVDIAAVVTYERNAWGNNAGDLESCKWVPGHRHYKCKIKNGLLEENKEKYEIDYDVIVEHIDSGSTCPLDPVIIIHH